MPAKKGRPTGVRDFGGFERIDMIMDLYRMKAGGMSTAEAKAEGEAAAALGDGLAGIVSLGVHRGPEFRLEQRAGARFESAQPDNDGVLGGTVTLEGPAERRPAADLTELRALLSAAGADRTVLSNDAGGYLCERVFREGLELGVERGVTALFLHVPPLEHAPATHQAQVVHDWLASWVR